jgi:hypothetical protein
VEVPFAEDSVQPRDAITGRERALDCGAIALGELLDAAPVAVLVF